MKRMGQNTKMYDSQTVTEIIYRNTGITPASIKTRAVRDGTRN
jgi:hypothetical protein